MIAKVEHPWEARSGVVTLAISARHQLVPRSMLVLTLGEPTNSLCDRIGAGVVCREEPEQGPCRLRGGRGADAALRGCIVGAAGFAPSASRVLHHADPLGGLLHGRLQV